MINSLIVLLFISTLIFLVMIWARFWPRVVCTNFDLKTFELCVNGETVYKSKVSYSYRYNEKLYESNRFKLFDGRVYASRADAQNFVGERKVYICPIKPSFSYICQDVRVFLGFLFLSFACLIFFRNFLFFGGVTLAA